MGDGWEARYEGTSAVSLRNGVTEIYIDTDGEFTIETDGYDGGTVIRYIPIPVVLDLLRRVGVLPSPSPQPAPDGEEE